MDPMLFHNLFGPKHSDVELLGRGASGEVWKARLLDGREVAVKYLIDLSNEGRSDFGREVRQLEELINETFIVNILGSNFFTARPYFYMELCAGTLDQFIGQFDKESIYDVLWCATQGLKAVHSLGPDAKHRDYKPKNVLVRPVGNTFQPVLSDFGLARVPDPRTLMTAHGAGTPPYMAPEILAGHPFTQKADIYSLGITFYELFSGKPERPWFSLNIPNNLNMLLARMTDENPQLRPDIWQVEREVMDAIDLRSSPVSNWLSKLTTGEFLFGACVTVGAIAAVAGGRGQHGSK